MHEDNFTFTFISGYLRACDHTTNDRGSKIGVLITSAFQHTA